MKFLRFKIFYDFSMYSYIRIYVYLFWEHFRDITTLAKYYPQWKSYLSQIIKRRYGNLTKNLIHIFEEDDNGFEEELFGKRGRSNFGSEEEKNQTEEKDE